MAVRSRHHGFPHCNKHDLETSTMMFDQEMCERIANCSLALIMQTDSKASNVKQNACCC